MSKWTEKNGAFSRPDLSDQGSATVDSGLGTGAARWLALAHRRARRSWPSEATRTGSNGGRRGRRRFLHWSGRTSNEDTCLSRRGSVYTPDPFGKLRHGGRRSTCSQLTSPYYHSGTVVDSARKRLRLVGRCNPRRHHRRFMSGHRCGKPRAPGKGQKKAPPRLPEISVE